MKNRLRFTGLLVTMVALQSNVAFGYGIAAKGIYDHGNPVHELITRKAAVDAKYLSPLDTYQMNNLIEGVRFNDDPEAYLGAGNIIGFGAKFLGDNKSKKNPTTAFHFGNYQFMHAMAKGGMPANKIKNRMMLYAYHCWMSATDNDSLAKFKAMYFSVNQKIKNKAPNSAYSHEELIAKDMVSLFPSEVLFYHTDNQNSFQNRALNVVFALDKNTSIESKKTHSHQELTQPLFTPKNEIDQYNNAGG